MTTRASKGWKLVHTLTTLSSLQFGTVELAVLGKGVAGALEELRAGTGCVSGNESAGDYGQSQNNHW